MRSRPVFSDDKALITLASAFASVIIGLAIALPRIMSGKKRDGLDQNFAEAQGKMLAEMQTIFQQQINSLKEANDQHTKKISDMHGLIDKYRVQLTIVRNTMYEVLGVLSTMGVVLPKETDDRIRKVLNDES